VPAGLTTLIPGSGGVVPDWDGVVAEIAIWKNAVLASATLQGITT